MDHPKIQHDDQGNLFLNFGEYGESVEVAAFSGNGKRMLTVREVGIARVWDIDSGTLIAELVPDSPLAGNTDAAPHASEFKVFIESASLNSDGTHALLGLNDGTAVVYCVDDSALVSVLHPPDETPSQEFRVIRCVRYSADDMAIVGFDRRRVGVWSTDGSEQLGFFDPQFDRLVGTPFVRDTLITSVDLSADGQYVFAGGSDLSALVFERDSGRVVFQASDHAESILAIYDGPSGVGWATTAGSVWMRRAGGELTKCLDTGEHWSEVTFHDDGEHLLTRASDQHITRWSLDGGRELLFESPDPYAGRIAENVQSLGFQDQQMHYPITGRRIMIREGGNLTEVDLGGRYKKACLMPQGDAIASGGWKESVDLWDAETGKLRQSFACPGSSGDFAFSPDGSLIAIGEIGNGGGLYPRSVYLIETATGRLVHQWTEHQWQIKQVGFSPDGSLLASLGDELIVWRLDDPAETCIQVPLHRTTSGFAFTGADLIVVEKGQVHVYTDGQLRYSFEAPIRFQTPWIISDDQNHLCVAGNQSVLRFDLSTGDLAETIAADIARPDRMPPTPLAREHEIRGAALHWQTEFGQFLHQSDGPRGWIEPVRSFECRVAIPSSGGASVLDFRGGEVVLLGTIPFEGKLRAGHVVDGECLLVNEKGRLYRTTI